MRDSCRWCLVGSAKKIMDTMKAYFWIYGSRLQL